MPTNGPATDHFDTLSDDDAPHLSDQALYQAMTDEDDGGHCWDDMTELDDPKEVDENVAD